MPTTKFHTRDVMVAILAGEHPTAAVVLDTVENQTTFATRHTLIWRDADGSLWRCHYTLGSTTAQDYSPWEGQVSVGSTLVRPQMVEVLAYVDVDGDVDAAKRSAEDVRRRPIPGDTWTCPNAPRTWVVVAVADWGAVKVQDADGHTDIWSIEQWAHLRRASPQGTWAPKIGSSGVQHA